jgi:hypothetical protein
VSRSSEVSLVVTYLQTLVQACSELALATRELKRLETTTGEILEVDFVVENKHGDKIGVKQTQSGEIKLMAADAQSVTACKTIDQMRQGYARIKIMEEVKRKGYQLAKEERLADGTVRMVVQRWQ